MLNSSKTKAGTLSSATIKGGSYKHTFLGLQISCRCLSIPQQKVPSACSGLHLGEIAEGADDETITHILLLVRNGPQANLIASDAP